MSYPRKKTVSITTDGSGDATEYTGVITGHIDSVIYNKTDFANGVDFTITTEVTAQGVWTESDVNAGTVRYPRAPTHSDVGVASLYAAAGEPVETRIPVVNERVKIVIGSGGSVKTGSFDVIYS